MVRWGNRVMVQWCNGQELGGGGNSVGGGQSGDSCTMLGVSAQKK